MDSSTDKHISFSTAQQNEVISSTTAQPEDQRSPSSHLYRSLPGEKRSIKFTGQSLEADSAPPISSPKPDFPSLSKHFRPLVQGEKIVGSIEIENNHSTQNASTETNFYTQLDFNLFDSAASKKTIEESFPKPTREYSFTLFDESEQGSASGSNNSREKFTTARSFSFEPSSNDDHSRAGTADSPLTRKSEMGTLVARAGSSASKKRRHSSDDEDSEVEKAKQQSILFSHQQNKYRRTKDGRPYRPEIPVDFANLTSPDETTVAMRHSSTSNKAGYSFAEIVDHLDDNFGNKDLHREHRVPNLLSKRFIALSSPARHSMQYTKAEDEALVGLKQNVDRLFEIERWTILRKQMIAKFYPSPRGSEPGLPVKRYEHPWLEQRFKQLIAGKVPDRASLDLAQLEKISSPQNVFEDEAFQSNVNVEGDGGPAPCNVGSDKRASYSFKDDSGVEGSNVKGKKRGKHNCA